MQCDSIFAAFLRNIFPFESSEASRLRVVEVFRIHLVKATLRFWCHFHAREACLWLSLSSFETLQNPTLISTDAPLILKDSVASKTEAAFQESYT
jgi:hypothetical protein